VQNVRCDPNGWKWIVTYSRCETSNADIICLMVTYDIVRRSTKAAILPSMAIFRLGAYKYHPNWPFEKR
jgi:hypothetical protein